MQVMPCNFYESYPQTINKQSAMRYFRDITMATNIKETVSIRINLFCSVYTRNAFRVRINRNRAFVSHCSFSCTLRLHVCLFDGADAYIWTFLSLFYLHIAIERLFLSPALHGNQDSERCRYFILFPRVSFCSRLSCVNSLGGQIYRLIGNKSWLLNRIAYSCWHSPWQCNNYSRAV